MVLRPHHRLFLAGAEEARYGQIGVGGLLGDLAVFLRGPHRAQVRRVLVLIDTPVGVAEPGVQLAEDLSSRVLFVWGWLPPVPVVDYSEEEVASSVSLGLDADVVEEFPNSATTVSAPV